MILKIGDYSIFTLKTIKETIKIMVFCVYPKKYANCREMFEKMCRSHRNTCSMLHQFSSQVGFSEFNNTADNRANIGGTIIGAPIVGL